MFCFLLCFCFSTFQVFCLFVFSVRFTAVMTAMYSSVIDLSCAKSAQSTVAQMCYMWRHFPNMANQYLPRFDIIVSQSPPWVQRSDVRNIGDLGTQSTVIPQIMRPTGERCNTLTSAMCNSAILSILQLNEQSCPTC